MDKQEYRIILEEINRAYLDENYDRVLMIAQELDVNKISDNHVLEIIADSYEQMGRADIAREVLLVAYERTPMGRQMAYKLCDISIKMNDLDNAAEFYHDFCRMAPNDSKKYILKYEIGKKGGVSRKNLVEVLETYCEKEMDEKYKYELANLYRATGRKEECIELCDEIMLWFADGAYAKKAEKLKDACLGIMQQKQGTKKRKTLSLFEDDNIEDIPDEQIEQYTQPKSEEIFDDAPAVEIQRLEDRPLMNENVSWRMPNKNYDPVITEPEPRPAQRLSYSDFDNSYEEAKDDYENYYSNWQSTPQSASGWAIIDESVQRGWTDPEDAYDATWEMPDDILDPQPVQEEFVEPVFGAHRPAHLRDDYVAPEGEQPAQNSPFAMPNRTVANNYQFNANAQPRDAIYPEAVMAQQAPAFQTPIMPQQAPAFQTPIMPQQAPAFQTPIMPQQAPAFQTPIMPQQAPTYQAPEFAPQEYAQDGYEAQDYAPIQEEPSLLGAKPFAFSIAPDAAVQNEVITAVAPVVSNAPNISEKASLVKKPVLKVGPVNEIKYKVPGGEYKKPADIPVIPFEPELVQEEPQVQFKTLTSSTQRQTSIPAPKTIAVEPIKVVMGPDGMPTNLNNKEERVSLGWDDNLGADFRTWGALNMNDTPSQTTEIDEEPDYFSTMLEIPRDKPTYPRREVPFTQQVPQTKFVELKSGTPFADPSVDLKSEEPYEKEAVEYIPKRSGIISAALGASTVAAIASEPEENLTETQKAIRAFGAGELTTDDLLERDDLDLGDDELNEEEDVIPSDYGYNDEWQQSEKVVYDNEPSELRRFRNSSERFDFEPEDDFLDSDEFSEDDFNNEVENAGVPELTEAEKAIMAFDAMNKSNNELDFFEEEEEEEPVEEEPAEEYIDYESEFDEFDDQLIDNKKPKVIEQEWTDSEMPEEEPVLEEMPEEPVVEVMPVTPVVEEMPQESEPFEEEFTEEFEENPDDEFDKEFEEDFDEVFNEEFEEDFEDEFDKEPEEFEEYEKTENSNEEFEDDFAGEDLVESEEFKDEFAEEGVAESEEFEENFEEKQEEPELSAAEKAILAFEAANVMSDEEEFDFDEDFDDVFNGEFTGEFTKEEPVAEVEQPHLEELFEKEELDESGEFTEELDEPEEFTEEYDESEEFTEEYNESEEFTEELDEPEEFTEEYDDSEEFDEYEELEEGEDFEVEEQQEGEEIEESEEVEETIEDEVEEPNEENEAEESEQEVQDIEVEIPDELREELAEFFLVEGMEAQIENTLSDIVNAKNKGHKLDANLIVSGDPKSGKTYLTIALIKSIGKILGNGNGRVAKVPAAALRGKKMAKVFEKVAGSDLIIENIGYLDDDTIKDLIETLKTEEYDSMVVLEGNNLAIENLTSKFPEILEIFKNRLNIDELTLPQWADIASDYAHEQGYVIGDMASLALHAKIDELNVPTRRLGTADIIEIVDEAIENANNRLSPKQIKKIRKKQEDIELIEDDFA